MSAVGLLLWVASVGVLIWGIAKRNKRTVMISVGLFAVSVAVAGFFPSGTGEAAGEQAVRSKWSARDVEVGCFSKVREGLVSPSSARFVDDARDHAPRWNPSELSWRYVFTIEAQNAFGVQLTSTWRCDIIDDEFIRVTEL